MEELEVACPIPDSILDSEEAIEKQNREQLMKVENEKRHTATLFNY